MHCFGQGTDIVTSATSFLSQKRRGSSYHHHGDRRWPQNRAERHAVAGGQLVEATVSLRPRPSCADLGCLCRACSWARDRYAEPCIVNSHRNAQKLRNIQATYAISVNTKSFIFSGLCDFYCPPKAYGDVAAQRSRQRSGRPPNLGRSDNSGVRRRASILTLHGTIGRLPWRRFATPDSPATKPSVRT